MQNVNYIDQLIGKNLKRLRTSKGLTQEQLADLIGSDRNVIAQIEIGIRGMGKKMQLKICEALSVKPVEFYIEDDLTRRPLSKEELDLLELYQEAVKFKVADDIKSYGEYRINQKKNMKIEWI